MIEATVENGVARSIRMESMKSFVELENGIITNSRITSLLSDSIDSIRFDISFGGMFYVIINADDYEIDIIPQNGRFLAKLGEMIKKEAKEKYPVNHPDFDYPGPGEILSVSY